MENEYGSYACDRDYMLWLRDLYKSYVGYKALLYTTDGCGYSYLACGSIPEVYATVDFGVLTKNSKYPQHAKYKYTFYNLYFLYDFQFLSVLTT